MDIDTLSDPTRLARAIRALARDAHHTLTCSPSAAALWQLSERIEFVAATLDDRREGPLGNWLESLDREVRAAATHDTGSPSFPMRVCA